MDDKILEDPTTKDSLIIDGVSNGTSQSSNQAIRKEESLIGVKEVKKNSILMEFEMPTGNSRKAKPPQSFGSRNIKSKKGFKSESDKTSTSSATIPPTTKTSVYKPKPNNSLSKRGVPKRTLTKFSSLKHKCDVVTKVMREAILDSGQTIKVVWGDLVKETVDAIVNAANGNLAHIGGLAHAISVAGGPEIDSESFKVTREWKEKFGKRAIPTGEAVYTSAGKLPCKYVIHAVGPVWYGGLKNEEELLKKAVRNSLLRAEELKCVAISIPAISSGIFHFPKIKCCAIIMEECISYFKKNKQTSVQELRLTNIDEETTSLLAIEFEKHFPQVLPVKNQSNEYESPIL